ncbi:MAG: cytochrome c oxidase subunit II, partial [Chloroflexi bacterium]|nr:cytochrome c oxidase subunit II [Chloroflexota bacterium]
MAIPGRSFARFVAPALSLALLVLLAGCSPHAPQSTFDPQGPVARMQLGLFSVLFWAAVFVFVVVEGILVYT